MPFIRKAETSVFPSLFRDSELRLENYEGVEYWQNPNDGAAISVTPNQLNVSTGQSATGTAVQQDYILGVFFDRDALATSIKLEEVYTSPINPRGSYFNTFYHWAKNYKYDPTENMIVYYMADYRDEDSTKWILNDNWDWMDLSELGAVKSIYFTMETTDVGDFGANTTFYFGLDQITIRPIQSETSIESLLIPNSSLLTYPNPCRDILHIEGVEKGEEINIYNLQGQLQLSTSNTQITTLNLSPGIYIIKSGSKTSKFIKQ
jgi:hypothetical protein